MKNFYFALTYDGIRLAGYNMLTESFFFSDSKTHTVHLVQDCLSQKKKEPYGQPCLDQGDVWFPPFNASELVRLRDDKISRYPIKYNNKGNCRFTNSFIIDNTVFLLPGCSRGIVLFNIENHREQVIDEWCHEYEQYIPLKIKNARMYGKSRYGSYLRQCEYLYMPLLHAPVILKLNLSILKSEVLYFEKQDPSGFLAIYENDDNHLFIITRSSNEIIEIKDDQVVNTYYADMGDDSFGRSLCYKGKIYITGKEKGRLCSFNIETKIVHFHNLELFFSPDNKVEFGSFICVDDHLMISDIESGKNLSIFTGSHKNEIREEVWKIDENNLQDILADKIKAGQIITENRAFTLERFLNINSGTEKKTIGTNIGMKIFKSLI